MAGVISETFDVIVIGAGPGGSNAATVALSNGLTVAQVDKASFPRIKPCGGGVTIKSSIALQHPLLTLQRGEYCSVEFNVWKRRVNRFAHVSRPVLRMVERQEFDNALVARNKECPRFAFFSNERVTDVKHEDGTFHVRTAAQVLRGRHLVGADGAYSLVNRTFQITQPRGYAVAVEVRLPRSSTTLRVDTPPCFDFGAIESGYGWVFPKDDHWNVGLYTIEKARDLRGQLRSYIAGKGFDVEGDPLATFVGHQVPYGGYRIKIPSVPVYVVGDAAGFADPIMGEGIYHALESGRIAGQTICDCVAGKTTHRAYYRRIRHRVLSDTFITYHVARAFYSNVDKSLTVLENPLVWRPAVQGYAHGATVTKALTRGGLFLLQSLVLRTLQYARHGQSPALALWGPLRGVAYLGEALVGRAKAALHGTSKSRKLMSMRASDGVLGGDTLP